jgi:hypothetical protein
MLYFVLHPEKENNFFNRDYFQNARNSLTQYISESERWSDAIKLIDLKANNSRVNLYMNAFTQKGLCYLTKK